MTSSKRSKAGNRKPGGICTSRILHGDCITLLRTLPNESVDLVCTDPPYGIGFMGHAWDTFRPGYQRKMLERNQARGPSAGHASLAFQGAAHAGSYDYSPKAQSAFQTFIRATSKECLRVLKPGGFMFVTMTPRQDSLCRVMLGMEEAGFDMGFTSLYWAFSSGFPKPLNIERGLVQRRGAASAKSAKGKALKGAYGSFQLKPAVEVIIVAMKPLSEKGYLNQAMKDGKGVTWLDTARIPRCGNDGAGEPGRFPANLLVSDKVLGDFSRFFSLDAWERETLPFLVVPKASKREKNDGLEGFEERQAVGGGGGIGDYLRDTNSASGKYGSEKAPGRNCHPTVKPLKLMAYLIALGSRPGDLVLDPFLGSGTTAVAAKLLGRRYVGIERERAYVKIARARVRTARLPA